MGLAEGAKSERAQSAWRNYHALVEAAMKRAGKGAGSHGAALFVELQSSSDASLDTRSQRFRSEQQLRLAGRRMAAQRCDFISHFLES